MSFVHRLLAVVKKMLVASNADVTIGVLYPVVTLGHIRYLQIYKHHGTYITTLLNILKQYWRTPCKCQESFKIGTPVDVTGIRH